VTFDEKYSVLRSPLFQAKMAPALQNFVNSKADLRAELEPVTIREVYNIPKRTRVDTTAGRDGFRYISIIQLYGILPQILLDLFNAIFKYSTNPVERKVINCVVVPKQEKATYQDPKSCRQNPLLSCFGNILESLIAQGVTIAAEECRAIVDTQMGRRKNYSAVDALIAILIRMSQTLRRKDKSPNPKLKHSRILPRPSLLTHDIDGAFNNTDLEVLTQIMEQSCLLLYI
jgi:hypothetical protein